MNDRLQIEESEDELVVPKSPNLMVTSPTFTTQETQTSLKSEPYHPPAEKLKVRKNRHRRASSYSSNAPLSPRLSPMRERRISSGSPRRSQRGSVADVEEMVDDLQTPFPMQLFFRHQDSTTSMNGHLTATSPEDLTATGLRRHSTSSSCSSNEVCQIVDDDPDNDILETLDRKVSEVINRSRLNSNSQCTGSNTNNADIYGPLSFSYNRERRNSPAAARRLSPGVVSGLVRFGDDEDEEAVKVGGNLTDDSSADDHDDRVQWSNDDDEQKMPSETTLNNAFTIKRKRYD